MYPKIMTISEMLNKAAELYFKYKSKEIIIVNLTTQEVMTGNTPADVMLETSWNSKWEVEVTSFRNDMGHISVTFNDNKE